MHRLFGITFVIAICCHSAGCGSRNEKTIDDFLGALETLTTILEGIETKEDAEAAKEKLAAASKRFSEIEKRVSEMKVTPSEKAKFDARLEKELKELIPRFSSALARLMTNPEIEPTLVEGLEMPNGNF